MSSEKSFRVWKLRTRDEIPDGVQPFAVNAASPEDAASRIACELSMGGFYRVHAVGEFAYAKIVRIVPVTTYEAVEEEALPSQADDVKGTT